jgi:condensin complex subunit 1
MVTQDDHGNNILFKSYPMRMAIIEIIGHLIRDLSNSTDLANDAQQVQKQINSFYDILLERTLDLSSYVRTKVLAVLAKLCDLPTKFPKQRLAVTRAAVDMLEDKVASARKGALALLSELVVTHPYGLMHGGLMGLEEWQERYNQVTGELKNVEDLVGKAVETGVAQDVSDARGEEEDEDNPDHEDDNESQSTPKPKKRHKQ